MSLFSKIRNALKPLWSSTPNLFSSVTVLVAIISAILSIVNKDPTTYALGLLAIVSLLAITQLVTNVSSSQRDVKIDELQDAILELKTSHISTQNFFQSRDSLGGLLDTFLESANTLDLAGASLKYFAIDRKPMLLKLKDNGCRIRIILSDPGDANLQNAIAARILEAHSGERHSELVQVSLNSFEPIIGKGKKGGNVEVRVSKIFPSFGYIGINTSPDSAVKDSSHIKVEVYLYKTPLREHPNFFLDPIHDVYWFNKFKEQFDKLWNSAKNPF